MSAPPDRTTPELATDALAEAGLPTSLVQFLDDTSRDVERVHHRDRLR